MLDIKEICKKPEDVKRAMRSRNMNLDTQIDRIIEVYAIRVDLMKKSDDLKAEQNKASRDIPLLKKQGKNTEQLMTRMKDISEQVKELSGKITAIEAEEAEILYRIPNVPHGTVPIGKDDSENVEVRKSGSVKSFTYTPLAHWDIGANLGILDPERAAKVTGARFHFYKGLGARLERAVINFYLNTHTEHGYTEIFPPFLVNRDSMMGTGQLPKFEEDAFKAIKNDTGNDYFLIPTAEVPVTNMHRDEILEGESLPLRYCAYSACFRAEAGGAGRDTRGLIRQHQFNKVELVKFAAPENSYEELEKLTKDAERVLQELELPYRVVMLSSGDLGFSSAKTYDIEVWMPSYDRYLEISSCSNFEDFQARRAAIRYKNSPTDKAQLIHTLNGSGVAIGRTVAAILENYQNEDGSVSIPKVLVPYMGCEVIK